MKVLYSATILTWCLTYAAVVPSPQNVLSNTPGSRVKVPGHNSAYYTKVAPQDQIFLVRELVVFPNPPQPGQHLTLYLDGSITPEVAGLDDTSLELSGVCPDYYEGHAKLSAMKRFVVRHGNEYSSFLRSGHKENELFWDTHLFQVRDPRSDPTELLCGSDCEVAGRLQRTHNYLNNFSWDGKTWGGADSFDKPPWPKGEYPLTLNDQDVVYKCDGSNAGALFDAGAGEKVGDCAGDLKSPDPAEKYCKTGQSREKRRRVVSCDF